MAKLNITIDIQMTKEQDPAVLEITLEANESFMNLIGMIPLQEVGEAIKGAAFGQGTKKETPFHSGNGMDDL